MRSRAVAGNAVVMSCATPRDRLWLTVATLAGATVVVGAVIAGASGGSSSPPLAPADLSGELVGRAPWPRNIAGLRARLQALGLPALAQEGTALHIHQHLDLYVDGRRVTVPAGIGIDESQGFISPLHTHDGSGVIHVESTDLRTFTLGQFFAVWGLRLTPRCLGGYCATGSKALRVFVDGKRFSGDPRLLPLARARGDPGRVRHASPASPSDPARFDFSAGL